MGPSQIEHPVTTPNVFAQACDSQPHVRRVGYKAGVSHEVYATGMDGNVPPHSGAADNHTWDPLQERLAGVRATWMRFI